MKSGAECAACGLVRGYIYTGAVYSTEELDDRICPWCIADGSAHLKFDAEFTDSEGVGDYVLPKTLDESIVGEVAFRTPGFAGWQQERWLSCCGDAAAFLGHVGHSEIMSKWIDAIPSLQDDCGLEVRSERNSSNISTRTTDQPRTYFSVSTAVLCSPIRTATSS